MYERVCNDAQTQQPHHVANAHVTGQHAPAAEDFRPVVVPATDQRQLLDAGVFHVAAHVHQVFSQPHQGGCPAYGMTPPREVAHEQDGKQELKERAAIYGQMAGHDAYEGMPCLMQGQVGMVKQEYPLLGGAEMRPDEPCAQCSQGDGRELRYGLPVVFGDGVGVVIHDGSEPICKSR